MLMQTEVRQSAKFIAEFSHHHLVKYIAGGGARWCVGDSRRESSGAMCRMVLWRTVMFGAIDELLSSAVFTGPDVYDSKATAAQVMDVLLSGIHGEMILGEDGELKPVDRSIHGN